MKTKIRYDSYNTNMWVRLLARPAPAVKRSSPVIVAHVADMVQALRLEGARDTDGFGSSGQPSGALITWGHQNANRLFYDSSNFMPLALSDKERAELVQVTLLHHTQLPWGPPMPHTTHQATALAAPLHKHHAAPPSLWLVRRKALRRVPGPGQAQGHPAQQHPAVGPAGG